MAAMRPCYKSVIDQVGLLRALEEFNPVVIGTPPLGIATISSDIDVACSSPDLERFADVAQRMFGQMQSFSLRKVDHLPEPAIVASFIELGWEIEAFCQKIPTEDQWGVRHFHIEARLLALAPQLRERVVRLKRDGVKTEPAFAEVLSLVGDPYGALLELESLTDEQLLKMISAIG